MTLAFEQLSESLRFEYLQAMGVTQWVPREQEEITQHQFQQESEDLVDVGHQADSRTINNDSVLSSDGETSKQFDESHIPTSSNKKVSTEQVDIEQFKDVTSLSSHQNPPSEQNSSSRQNPSSQQKNEANAGAAVHYLKVVSWGEAHDGEQTLMIICRHQKDQPAQSFARANSPSQFMLDYIRALKEVLGEAFPAPRIHLSHLSQAGLGQGCQQMNEVVAKIAPSCVLLLGDETVVELFGRESSVANKRGQKLLLDESIQTLVSYHPYSLIKNPKLKPLALEDLKLLSAVLKA